MATHAARGGIGRPCHQSRNGGFPCIARGLARPTLEPLEPRQLLSVVYWDGGGDGSNWHDPLNWDADVLPAAADDVRIDVPDSPLVLFTPDAGSQVVRSLQSVETIHFTGGELRVTTSAEFAGETVLNGGTLAGGVWTMTGVSLRYRQSTVSTLAGPIIVNGTIESDRSPAFLRVTGGLRLNGQLLVTGSDIVEFSGSQMFSAGRIHFEEGEGSSSRLVRVSGPDGTVLTIDEDAQVTGGGNSWAAQIVSVGDGVQSLVNLGLINANADIADIRISTDFFENLGTVTATGSSSRVGVFSPSWDNSYGILGVTDGMLYIGGTITTAALNLATLQRDGGWVILYGTLDNSGDTLRLNAQTGSIAMAVGTLVGGDVVLTEGAELLFGYNPTVIGPITIYGNIQRDFLRMGAGSLQIEGGMTLYGTLTLRENDRLTFWGTQTFSAGTIALADDGPHSRYLEAGGTDGAVVTIGADARIVGGSSTGLTRILSYGNGTQTLVNLGLIEITGDASLVELNTESFANRGMIHLVGVGATLQLVSPIWDNSGGNIVVEDGDLLLGGTTTGTGLGSGGFMRLGGSITLVGTVENTADSFSLGANTGDIVLDGAAVIGGSVFAADGARVLFSPNPANCLVGPIAIVADLDRSGDTGQLMVTGGLELHGVLTVRGGDIVTFDGTQTFESGTIRFLPDDERERHLYISGAGGALLTIGADATISGGSIRTATTISSLGSGTQALDNHGTIWADENGYSLLVYVDALSNYGRIGATHGGKLRINTGPSGTIWTNDGTITLGPGGRVELLDDVELAATSAIEVVASASDPSGYGVLAVTGHATLAGSLRVSYSAGYVPAQGTFFDLLTTTGGLAGRFDSDELPTAPPGDKTVLVYEGTRVRLLSTDLADIDLDGVTNTQDFLFFLNLWASNDPASDMDGNGIIDTRDFLFFLNAWTDG